MAEDREKILGKHNKALKHVTANADQAVLSPEAVDQAISLSLLQQKRQASKVGSREQEDLNRELLQLYRILAQQDRERWKRGELPRVHAPALFDKPLDRGEIDRKMPEMRRIRQQQDAAAVRSTHMGPSSVGMYGPGAHAGVCSVSVRPTSVSQMSGRARSHDCRVTQL